MESNQQPGLVAAAEVTEKRRTLDPELKAMRDINQILEDLDVAAARRVLSYVHDRHLERQVVAKRAEFAAGAGEIRAQGPRLPVGAHAASEAF